MGSFSDKNCTIVVTNRGQRLVWWSTRGITFMGWETLGVMPGGPFWATYVHLGEVLAGEDRVHQPD